MSSGEIIGFGLLGLIMVALYINIYMFKRVQKKDQKELPSDKPHKEDFSGFFLFSFFLLSLALRALEYLPFNTFIVEVGTLFLAFVFHMDKQDALEKYEASNDEAYKEKALSKRNSFRFTLAAYFFIVLFGIYLHSDEKESYTNQERFVCKNRDNFEIYIDKNDGWKLEDNYFVKDKSRIYTLLCKETNNEQ